MLFPSRFRSGSLRIGARYRALNVIKGDSADAGPKSRERAFAAFIGKSELGARWWANLRGRCCLARSSNGLTRNLRSQAAQSLAHRVVVVRREERPQPMSETSQQRLVRTYTPVVGYVDLVAVLR